MKRVASLLFALVLLMAVFTFFPTGSTASEVLEGYQSTTTFSRSNAAHLLYMTQFQVVQERKEDTQFAKNIGEKIAAFGTELSERLGNGGTASQNGAEGRKVGQFRYSIRVVNRYDTLTDLRQGIIRMLRDPSETNEVSCCAFATFTWSNLLNGRSPYGLSTTATIQSNFQNIIEGDGTAQYIIEHAEPGDLLFYTKDRGKGAPPIAANRNYTHTELYVGAYSGVDARGERYEIAHAIVGSNLDVGRRDAYIKALESSVSNRDVYMVSLSKWIASGNEPIDNADEVESIEEIIQGGGAP